MEIKLINIIFINKNLLVLNSTAFLNNLYSFLIKVAIHALSEYLLHLIILEYLGFYYPYFKYHYLIHQKYLDLSFKEL